MRLLERVAVVTGASRGIGRAIALALAREGADVAVNYVRAESSAMEVVSDIRDMGRRALPVRADVAQQGEVEAMIEKATTGLGEIDVLVNNAGIVLPFDFAQPDYTTWQRMVDVNVRGVLHCSRAVAEGMLRRGRGKIINIVIRETKGSLDYTMTKAAADVLTRGLARELAPSVLVNAIAPGYIDTGYISAMSAEEQEALREHIPLKRWGRPDNVARVAVFLASDDADWMTGTTILVDGGETLSS